MYLSSSHTKLLFSMLWTVRFWKRMMMANLLNYFHYFCLDIFQTKQKINWISVTVINLRRQNWIFSFWKKIKKRLNYLLIMTTEAKLNYKGTVMPREKSINKPTKVVFWELVLQPWFADTTLSLLKIHTAFNTLPALLHFIFKSQAT